MYAYVRVQNLHINHPILLHILRKNSFGRENVEEL